MDVQQELIADTQRAKQKQHKFSRRRDGFYHLPDGRRFVSVTRVIDCMDDGKTGRLMYWAAKTAAQRVLEDPETYDEADKAARTPREAKEDKAEIGTLVHSMIEALMKGGKVEYVPEDAKGYYDAFQTWAGMLQPKPIYTECNLYSDEHGYAGTTDLIAAFTDRQIRLVDFKTSGDIYEMSCRLQVAAYRRADFILPRGPEAKRIPMVPVAECGIVLLRPDGTHKWQAFRGTDEDFGVFLSLKQVHEWLQKSKRRAA